MTRGKIILTIVLSVAALFIIFIVIAGWSFTKLMKEGAVDTLDSMNYHAKFSTAKTKEPVPTNSTAVSAESKTAPSLGSDTAPIKVVEFIDFGCPYSKEENAVIRELAVSNPDRVWLQDRNFTTIGDDGLLLHPGAQAAAYASYCAGEQGKYWAMNDVLFANQNDAGTFAADDLRRYAIGAGVDGAKYDACIISGKTAAAVSADYKAGLALGVTGTPTFFVNGYKIDGAIPADVWQKILKLVK
jgi:protein-disulfide isomerase